jgi:peptidoglycan/LPS O-acetylase OafA/YrhL
MSSAPAPASPHTTKILPEIQGLRCWAVLLVTVFHLWPSVLPGGFIGVDVFFVISGFLITGLLIREAEREGRISLLAFYARRILRLLPMATLIILLALAALPLMPAYRWDETWRHALAATLYAENWWLAHLAVDYLGADELPSPLQHYWSLSIEEQFYFFWPLLILITCWVAAKWRRFSTRSLATALLAILYIISFAASIWLTYRASTNAYFFTHTRLWELAAGGLLALAPWRPAAYNAKRALAIGGLLAIITSAIVITPASKFPGFIALAPVLGTIAVILSGGVGIFSRYALNALPYRFIGDISYSIYLWHWPIIVYYSIHNGNPGLVDGLMLLAITILLAAASKYLVEDYFLKRASWRTKLWRVYLLGFALVAVSVLAALGARQYIRHESKPVPLTQDRYPGAMTLTHGIEAPKNVKVQPSLFRISRDVPDVYARKCHVRFGATELAPCKYGNPEAKLHVMLVGDSHAAHWVPALAALAQQNNWRFTSHTKAGCPAVEIPLLWKGKPYPECTAWMENLQKEIARTKPDIIIQSQLHMSRPHATTPKAPDEFIPQMVDSMHTTWAGWRKAGIEVVVIPDTPMMPKSTLKCVQHGQKCTSYTRAESLNRRDPLLEAAQSSADVTLMNMNDAICNAPTCNAIVGNIIVFRDFDHISSSYARSIAPALSERLAPVIAKINARKP